MRQQALDDRLSNLEREVELRQWRAAILAALPERHRAAAKQAIDEVIEKAEDDDSDDGRDLLEVLLDALPESFARALAVAHIDMLEAEAGAARARTWAELSPDGEREAWGELLSRAGELEVTGAADGGEEESARLRDWYVGQVERLARDPEQSAENRRLYRGWLAQIASEARQERASTRRTDGPNDRERFHAWVDAQLDLLAHDPEEFWRWSHE